MLIVLAFIWRSIIWYDNKTLNILIYASGPYFLNMPPKCQKEKYDINAAVMDIFNST